MNKFPIAVGLAFIFGLSALAGCAATDGDSAKIKGERDTDLGSSEVVDDFREPQEGNHPEESPKEQPEEIPGEKPEENPEEIPEKEYPVVSPLAILDAVDVSAAFGDRDAEGWSFALKGEGDLTASYGFRLTSEISNEEKVNLECGLGIGLEDLFGLRSQDNNASGFGLFGGGEVSLFLNYRGPAEDSDPVSKSLDVGFRHDGDLIWYAGEDESEMQTSLSELKAKVEETAMAETFERMENAFMVIPEELNKGASLRFAVEKLIDLGFTVEIDDSDGVAVTLKAGAGFYTDLLNDMLEEFIPAKWLDYLPRADFGYERTVFNIKLAFGGDGLFKEYSMSSDVALTASLEVRKLFDSESTIKVGGELSFTAQGEELQMQSKYSKVSSDNCEKWGGRV